MKYLYVGIWHGERPETQNHSSDQLMDVADATRQITLHAGREDVPDVILVISDSKCLYDWRKNNEVLQSEFDESQGRPWPTPQ